MTDFPSLEISEVGGQLIVHWRVVENQPQLDRTVLRALIDQAGFGQWPLNDDKVTTFLACCNASPGDFDMPIGEPQPASVKVEIAADAMCAWVTVVPSSAGDLITQAAIGRALLEADVVLGIDEAALVQVCQAQTPARIAVAKGVPPLPGEDARFELLIDATRSRAPKVNDEGLIDFRELGEIVTVTTGLALMRRFPAGTGVYGHDVRGQLVMPKPGRDHRYAAKLSGVEFSRADPELLVAAVKGQPVLVVNGVMVEPVLHLQDVNMATGNINFDGSVQIDGDVLSGMLVRASGDIDVKGTVDGGILEAGGSVQVKCGIIAQAKVRAEVSVAARFVENASIFAGTAIAIDEMALQSDLQALNQIVIGVKAPQRGRLVGGSARAMMLIQTPVLGASTSAVTHAQVGVNPVLDAQHKVLGQRAEKLHHDLESLKQLVQHLVRTGGKADLLERAKSSWKSLHDVERECLREKSEIEKQLASIAGARVEVTKGVTGAVDMVFGNKARSLQRSYDAGTFTLVDDQIVFTGKDGSSDHDGISQVAIGGKF